MTYEATGKEPDLAPSSGGAANETGAVKIRDRASPVLRRCFADLLSERDIPNAG